MAVEKLKACKQENCKIAQDGKCLEGLDINDCPHFYWDENGIDDSGTKINESSDTRNISRQPTYQLFPGTELEPNQISIITNKYSCKLTVILGEFDCGKTTLLSSIFDLFQIGHFKNYLFAGSLTQIGFEERSHLSRSISGSEIPDTERTKSLEFRLLHIGVKKRDSSKINHLILSDISGETIRQARNSGSVMKSRLSLVKDADYVVYMFDGEKLNPANRSTTLLNSNLFIQSALDNGIFDQETVLNVIISKWDLVSKDSTFNLETDLINLLDTRFKGRLKDVKYSFMAARPDEPGNKDIGLGFGVEAFLDTITSQDMPKQIENTDEVPQYERNFANFKMRIV